MPNQSNSKHVQVTQYSIKTENYIVTLQATAANNVASSEFQPPSIPPIINLDLSINSNDCNLEIPYTTDILHPLECDAHQENDQNTNPPKIVETQISENLIDKEDQKTRKLPRKKRASKTLEMKESTAGTEILPIEPVNYKNPEGNASDLSNQCDVLEMSIGPINHDQEINDIAEEDDGDESDASVDLADEKQLNEHDHDDRDYSENDKFAGFPKILIKDTRLVIRGKTLLDLMSR